MSSTLQRMLGMILLSCIFAGSFRVVSGRDAGKACGQVVGVVRYVGKVPPPRTIQTSDGGTLQHSDLIVDAKSQGLLHVAAYLEDAPAQAKLKDAKPVAVDQRDWVFIPRVVAVQHGRPVQFDNSDQVNHSVEAVSLVKANQFNAVAGPGQPVTHVFEPQKGPVQIGCSLHPWMRAWVYVLPHPWFAVTSTEGKFQIRDVPPGKYQLLVVHPDTNLRARRAVEVIAGQTVQVDVRWDKLP